MPVSLNFGAIAPLIGENDEERRRRIRPRPGAPLPDALPPSPMPLPAPGNPGSMAGPSYGARPQSRYDEMSEARDTYLQKTPGRGKSALKGALQGYLQGGGLAGAAMGGIYGAADPRGLREQEFNQRIRPQIQERFGYEDQDRAAQIAELNQRRQSALDAAKLAGMESETNLHNAQAEKARMPEPAKQPTPEWKLGRNNATGQFKWFNAANPEEAAAHTPHVNQPNQPSRFVVNERGEYVDVNAEAAAGRKVKAYQRPRAGGAGTQANKKKEPPKYVSMTEVRQFAEENNISQSQATAAFQNKGYRISR